MWCRSPGPNLGIDRGAPKMKRRGANSIAPRNRLPYAQMRFLKGFLTLVLTLRGLCQD
jgi:hypothetical protein